MKSIGDFRDGVLKQRFFLSAVLVILLIPLNGQAESPGASAAIRTFCGSTPCEGPIRELLGISTNGAQTVPELMEWRLTLVRDAKTLAPDRYELRYSYGVTTPNQTGLRGATKTVNRAGAWTTSSGARSSPRGTIHHLADDSSPVSLREISSNVLHILEPDGSLMVGNGGWSYTLNSTDAAETPVDPALLNSAPDMSYRIAPVSTGPEVHAVFEGRTPCQGIARYLNLSVPAAAPKAKWRVTLYQHPDTKAPTKYKIEGTLFRADAREGSWNLVHGSKSDPQATLYKLVSDRQPPIFLLQGDDNVLFLADEQHVPMVGHCEFSYTLNRRSATPAVSQR